MKQQWLNLFMSLDIQPPEMMTGYIKQDSHENTVKQLADDIGFPEKPPTIGLLIVSPIDSLVYFSSVRYEITDVFHIHDDKICHEIIYYGDFKPFTPDYIVRDNVYFLHESPYEPQAYHRLKNEIRIEPQIIISQIFPMYEFTSIVETPFSSKLLIQVDYQAYYQSLRDKE